MSSYREAIERWAVEEATPEDMAVIQRYIDRFGGMMIPDDVRALVLSHAGVQPTEQTQAEIDAVKHKGFGWLLEQLKLP